MSYIENPMTLKTFRYFFVLFCFIFPFFLTPDVVIYKIETNEIKCTLVYELKTD